MGLCSQSLGLLRKTLPAPPNWHRMSGPGRLPPPTQTVPIETGPPAKTLGPRSDPGPGAAGRPLAKFEPGSSGLSSWKCPGLPFGKGRSVFRGSLTPVRALETVSSPPARLALSSPERLVCSIWKSAYLFGCGRPSS